MPFRVVLDSDGLIKLAKVGILEVVVGAWTCLIPQAVWAETVERGMKAAYPDALAIHEALGRSTVQPASRHPRAAALLAHKRGLGRGEQEALHLFFAARADAIISDDIAFLTVLGHAGVRYLPPALVLVQLARERHLELRAALEGLEQMRPFVRPEVYQAARSDLAGLRPRRPRRTLRGGSP